MRCILFLVLSFCINLAIYSQQKITFYSGDSVLITADLYKTGETNSYILFFHQEEGSRGEYNDIAPKIKRQLAYNCLSVDLRYGNKSEFVKNESSEYAKSHGIPDEAYDARKDIEAAVNYAFRLNHKPVILFGSSFSASLCLLVAKNNPKVKAVIAFSPGEFFGSKVSVRDSLKSFNKPVFLASTTDEAKYLKELTSGIPAVSRTIFSPSGGKGLHGSRSLDKSCNCSNEYWLALSLFFRDLAE